MLRAGLVSPTAILLWGRAGTANRVRRPASLTRLVCLISLLRGPGPSVKASPVPHIRLYVLLE